MGVARAAACPALAAILTVLAIAGAAAAAPPFAFDFAGPGTPAPGALGAVGGDVTVDSEGSVWAEDPTENRVVKYDYNGGFIAAFTQPEGLGTPFADTNGLGADDRGGVYVVDAGTRVVKMDLGGRHVRTYGTAGPAPLLSASDVAVGADGVVHVLEDGRIARYRQDGTALPDVALPGSVADGLDLVVAPSGDYYVNTASRIVRVSPAGVEVGGIPVFNAGEGLAADTSQPALRIYGKTGFEGQIREYAADLTPVGTLTTTEVSVPTGIAVDCRGTVYVVDRNPAGSRILKFDDPATPPPPCAPPAAPPGAVETQVNDIDVTQGVQWDRDYTAVDSATGPRERTFGVTPGSPMPTEVPMRAGGKTVVRVYANLRSGPAGGIANIPVTLTARGRTIQPDAIQPVLRVGDARVDPGERVDRTAAFTFTLPDEWTRFGRLDLTARVNPAAIGCDAACQRRSTFVLRRIPFQQTAATCLLSRVACTDRPFGVSVWPVALRVDGRDPAPDPKPLFDAAHATTPMELSVWGWMGQIEIGDIVRTGAITTESCFLGIELGILCSEETEVLVPGSARERQVLQGLLFERIERFKADRRIDSSTVVMGVLRPVHPALAGANRGKLGEGAPRDASKGPRGYVNVSRPITSTAHELQHALGRSHAGRNPTCYPDPAQVGEAWPDPNDSGAMLGFGLDTRPRSGGAAQPYRVFASTAAAPLFDLMSYCGRTDDTDTWISTIGWNQLISYRAPGGAVPNAVPAARATAIAGGAIRVSAVELEGGRLAISGTSPGRGAVPAPDPAATYQLEARDAAGAILASAPMSAEAAGDGPLLLYGTVAAPAGTAQVVVRRGTETATRRRRSATPPTVRLLSPRPGARIAGRAMTVAWRASDRDGDRLVATVEVSLDGGRSFRPVHVGPSAGRVAIPTRILGDSRNARVRVRADDGFDAAEARSGRLVIVGPPPAARIISPARGQRVRADAPLRLEGEATAAGGRPLRSAAFRWSDGRRAIARGSAATVAGLRPGRRTIRLTVTDGRRRASVALPVTVTAVRPAFLRLDRPAALGRNARTVRLRVASTVAADLLVAGRRFPVGPVARTVSVPVRRGAAPVRLTLRLRSGRLATTVPITIGRR